MRVEITEKAKAELQPGVRRLGQRERTSLLLAEVKSAGRTSSRPVSHRTGDDSVQHVNMPSEAEPPTAGVGTDSFEGKRSLATARMFLFDIAERMFVRRDPLLAKRFREATLSVSREVLVEVEKVAG